MATSVTMLELSNYVARNNDRVLSIEDVADAMGIKVSSLRVYAARSNKRRMDGLDSATNLPLPDFTFGRSPLWAESTIRDWRGGLVSID